MRHTRLYVPGAHQTGLSITLEAPRSHYLLHVLRLKIADRLIVFDGQGQEFLAEITAIEKKLAQIRIQGVLPALPESPLLIHLGQAVSRGEKMDYTLQKAVELGVACITPLLTARSGVHLSAERWESKWAHWQQVVISACEQAGRSTLPLLCPIQTLPAWLPTCSDATRLILHPRQSQTLKTISPAANKICLLVGSEGGFSEDEVALAQQTGFTAISLGPRILRTETAAPAAIAAAQCLWGDVG